MNKKTSRAVRNIGIVLLVVSIVCYLGIAYLLNNFMQQPFEIAFEQFLPDCVDCPAPELTVLDVVNLLVESSSHIRNIMYLGIVALVASITSSIVWQISRL